MNIIEVPSLHGFRVGERLRISSEVFETQVVAGRAHSINLAWPYGEPDTDPDAPARWDGTIVFPRDDDHYQWNNTPYRTEPSTSELAAGDWCFVGIPPTDVEVTALLVYEPPVAWGWLPRPTWAIGLCAVADLHAEEAGYVLYPESRDQAVIFERGA